MTLSHFVMEQTEGSINILWYQNFFMINCNMLMAVTKFYFVNGHFIPVLLFSTLYPSSRAPAKVLNQKSGMGSNLDSGVSACWSMLTYAKGGGAIVSLSAPMRVVGESILAKFLELQSCWITMHIQVSVLGMEDIRQVLHGFEGATNMCSILITGVNAQGYMDFHALCSVLIKVATPHDTTKKIDGQALQMTSGIRLAGWYITTSTNLLVTNLSFNQADVVPKMLGSTLQNIPHSRHRNDASDHMDPSHGAGGFIQFNAEHPEA
ncbi:hypothetical protein EDB19DRAFT_1834296 [Suillus lakei]|nr:hypothetical protein EDB19DRAFT_1834296 [Suillus lakei]